MAPTLLTVILNYRTAEMTLRSAEAALRAMEGIAGGIVIVDNDSGDGSFEKISQAAEARGWLRDGRVRVIASGRNGGFAAGCNIGIRANLADGRRPDFFYLLNSDAFPDPDAIRLLLEHMQRNPGAGLAGSYVHGPDGTPHETAFRFHSVASEFEGAARIGPISRLLARHIVALPVPDEDGPVDWTAGASLMLRREMLDEVGLFDETFFLYFEETDLCRRARAAGWRTDYVRKSAVTHIGSVSTGMNRWDRVPGYWFDSRMWYFVKNHGRGYAAAATLAHVAGGMLCRLRNALQRRPMQDPRLFLIDMIGHALRSVLGGLLPQRKGSTDSRGGVPTGGI